MKICDIDMLHYIYKSDIRSIINFLQLNQNIHKSEWKTKILNDIELKKLHMTLCDKTTTLDYIVSYIHDISKQYNVDKKTILLSYFNLLMRNDLMPITDNLLLTIESIIHNNQLQSIDLIKYFYVKIKQHF